MAVVSIRVAKATFASLLERALAGEEIVIARGSEPIARLEPIGSVERAPVEAASHPDPGVQRPRRDRA